MQYAEFTMGRLERGLHSKGGLHSLMISALVIVLEGNVLRRHLRQSL